MSGPFPGAGSNPLAGGSSANTPATNPLAGGLPNQNPAQGTNPAVGGAGSNPLAGGSSDPQTHAQSPTTTDDSNGNETISADVFREKMRSEAALRKRVQELEAYRQAQEDAKLTEQERTTKRLAEIEAREQAMALQNQNLRLQIAVEARVRDRNLVDPSAVRAILMAEYADQLDFDDDGKPTNAEYLIDRAVEKYPFLVNTPPAANNQPPGSGRPVSPPRAPNGQYAAQNLQSSSRQNQPVPPSEWPRLSDIDWTKPGGQG